MSVATTRRVFRAQQKEIRKGHRKRIAAALLSYRVAHGTVADLSAAAGVSGSRWQQWEKPEDPATITLADVATLAETEPVHALAITRFLADSMGALVAPAPDPAESLGDWLARLARLTRELSDVLTTLSTALADGRLDPQELADAEREMTEAMVALMEGINAVKAARREHGVVIPMPARAVEGAK